jgi:putative transposase
MITYTFKIKTTKSLELKFEEHLNITRYIYNLAKETKEYAYSKGVKLSKFDLCKQLPELKKEFTWIFNVNANTLQSTIERLDKSYKKFFKDFKEGKISKLKQDYINKCLKNGTEINQKKLFEIGKPKWAKKKDWESIEFNQGNTKRITPDLRFEKDGKFNLPKLGKVKIFKSREVYGNIKLARVVKKVDGWYLQIVTDHEIQKCNNQAQVGIDVGITHFAVTSDGQFFENIKTTNKYAKKLADAQRKLALKKRGSNNFYKEVEKVKKIYLKIQRVREDYLHKVSRELANNYQTVFVEDLDVSKMVQNKNYSKAISDVSWSKFAQYLEYKTELIKIDAKYSSQECNNCGYVAKENRPNQETFKCVKCSHEGNADFLASLTILKRGQTLLENYDK